MKRPYLIYLVIVMQLAICVGIGALIVGIVAVNTTNRDINDRLAQMGNGSVQETMASEETEGLAVAQHCSPSSRSWPVYETRTSGPDGCIAERYERRMVQYSCTVDGEETRHYDLPASEWKLIARESVC